MKAMLMMMQLMFGDGGEACKVEYRLMADPLWYVLDDSGIDDHTTKGVQYGEGDSA